MLAFRILNLQSSFFQMVFRILFLTPRVIFDCLYRISCFSRIFLYLCMTYLIYKVYFLGDVPC